MFALLVLVLLGAGGLYVYSRFRFWSAQGKLMQKSGHKPPPMTLPARLFWHTFAPILSYLFVGPTEVHGRENLKNIKGRHIYTANHPFNPDFAQVAKAIGKPFTIMTKSAELKGAAGVFGAWTRNIPVNTKVEGGGRDAANAITEVLLETPKSRILMFAQGGLYPKAEREQFRTGVARAALAAAEQDSPAYIVPLGLAYMHDAVHKSASHRLFRKTRSIFRKKNEDGAAPSKETYGGVVFIGEPMSVQTLPKDVEKITDLLFERVRDLEVKAEARREALAEQRARRSRPQIRKQA